MKRKDLIKLLEKNGWYLKRNGGNHDIYTNGKDIEPVSRQVEIKERVAQAIIKRRSLKCGLRPSLSRIYIIYGGIYYEKSISDYFNS